MAATFGNMAASSSAALAAVERRLSEAMTGVQLLGATAKDFDAQSQAKGVLEKRMYEGKRRAARAGNSTLTKRRRRARCAPARMPAATRTSSRRCATLIR